MSENKYPPRVWVSPAGATTWLEKPKDPPTPDPGFEALEYISIDEFNKTYIPLACLVEDQRLELSLRRDRIIQILKQSEQLEASNERLRNMLKKIQSNAQTNVSGIGTRILLDRDTFVDIKEALAADSRE